MASEEPSYDKAKAKGQEGESKPQQIRFILSSINLRALENITSRLLKSA